MAWPYYLLRAHMGQRSEHISLAARTFTSLQFDIRLRV